MRQSDRRFPPFLVQLADLTLIQLSNWRWSWRSMVVLGMAAPLFGVVAFGLFARDAGPEALGYVLTGNVVLSLMFENLNKVSGSFAFMRVTGALDHFATLPIRRYALVLATVLSFVVLSLPALTVTVVAGSLFLGVPMALSPLVVLVVPLTAVPLAGLGALIGSGARTPEEANSLSLLGTLVMAGLGPVIVPPDRLPHAMLALGRLSPATYAASAWRQVLFGPLTTEFVLDAAVLAGLAAAVLWLVGRRVDWRQD